MAKSYQTGQDNTYCYPGTNVLKNKMNIHDNRFLWETERRITSLTDAKIRHQNNLPNKIDSNYLQSLHKQLFEPIYEWAGKFRTVEIAKGEMFCNSMFIKEQLQKTFDELNADMELKQTTDKTIIADKLAYYMSEINAVHPFREGNGRTQRLLMQKIAQKKGFELDFRKTEQNEMIDASKASFMCNYEPMKKVFNKIITPLEQTDMQQSTGRGHEFDAMFETWKQDKTTDNQYQ